jgi:hypothetical protein
MVAQSKPQYEIKVYKIWYADAPEEFYIGSTKYDTLYKRMSDHRNKVKIGRKSKLYQLIRSKGIYFNYSQIASCMVSCKDEQRAFEQQFIDELHPTLNSNRAHGWDIDRYKQIKKEYKQRPQYKQKIKEYFQRPGVKQKQKEYDQRPDIKQMKKEYYQRPDIKQKQKERMKEYDQRPDRKQKKKEYDQRPDIKQMKKEYYDSKKRTCVCGCKYISTPYYAKQHYKTKCHQEFISGLPFPLNGGK